MEPRLIILDEPFTGLDAGSARLVKSVLRERARTGCAVIMTTHILEVAERMADRIGVMVAGRLPRRGEFGRVAPVTNARVLRAKTEAILAMLAGVFGPFI